jgi:hypothetical protein
MDLIRELRDRTDEVTRTRENSARPAFSYARYRTTGQGSVVFGRRVDFGLTYIEEPYMSYGSMVDENELAEKLDMDSGGGEDTPMPVCSGSVIEWDVDTRGFYVGAWVAVRVYFPKEITFVDDSEGVNPKAAYSSIPQGVPEVPVDLGVEVVHMFTFSAIALKDVPVRVDE